MAKTVVRLSLVLAIIGVAVLAGCQAQQPAAGTPGAGKILRAATGSMGSSSYTLTAAAAKLLKKYANIDLAVRSGGTAENPLLLERGELDVANATGVGLFEVYKDDVPNRPLRVLQSRFPASEVLMVPKNSPINSLSDIKGKRIGIGVQGSSGVVVYEHIITALGISKSDVSSQLVSSAASVTSMREGSLDGFLGLIGIPAPPLIDMASSPLGLKMVNLTEEECKKVQQKYPAASYVCGKYSASLIPGYTGPDFTTIDTYDHWLVKDTFSEDLAYTIVKTLAEHQKEWEEMYSLAKNSTPENIVKNTPPALKFHPGAAKYFKEIGVLK